MNDEAAGRSNPGKDEGEQPLSPRAILVVLTLLAFACIGGYFLLMKLIDISQQEDCLLAHRRNCAAIEVRPGP